MGVSIKDLRPNWLSINNYIIEAEEPVQIYGQVSNEHQRAQSQRENVDLLIELMKLGEILGLGTAAAEKLGKDVLESDITDVTALKKQYAEEAIKFIGGQKPKVSRRKGAMKKKVPYESTDVIHIVNEGLKNDIAAAQSLKDAGLTATFDEFV